MNLFEKIGLIKSKEDREIEELAYEKAAKELTNENYKEGLKAKAYSQASGDENKADAIYIELRAKQLVKEIRTERLKEKKSNPEHQEKLKNQHKENKKTVFFIFALLLAVLSILLIVSYVENNAKSIETNEAEIIEPNFQIEEANNNKKAILSGRIRNKSDHTINSISLRIRLFKVNYIPPNFEKGQTISREEFSKLFPPWGTIFAYKDTLDNEDLELVGEQIDSEDLRIRNLNIPSGETKSFNVENTYTKLNSSDYWVWDYQTLRVSSY